MDRLPLDCVLEATVNRRCFAGTLLWVSFANISASRDIKCEGCNTHHLSSHFLVPFSLQDDDTKGPRYP